MSTHPAPTPPPALAPELVDLARARIAIFAENARAAGVDPAAASRLSGQAPRVWACSDFVSKSCARHPRLLVDLVECGDLCRSYAPGDYARKLSAFAGDSATESELMQALRRFKRREMVRIAWRDLCGEADFGETVRDTSAFADAVLESALAHLHGWQCAKLGEPRDAGGAPQSLIVLALGKLGAGELNFSSDIDLIFAFPESGQLADSPRALSKEEFFLRLARRFIHTLSETTEDGFVFRVDMRLRPFGASGPLVASVNAIEDYYQIHGRDWERYALIRARPVAGDTESGHKLLERLRPFVYRRYLDFGALESLREMKALVSAEVARKSMQSNIKLGPGGIREVEFIGQAFQMVRGGRITMLRDREILEVLERLAALDLMPEYAVAELRDAYRFLRTTEHRLQQEDDQQVHTLPEDGPGRARLAAGMGFADWNSFLSTLGKHRARVQSHFDQVYGAEPGDAEGIDDGLPGLWAGNSTPEQAHATLETLGFPDTARAGALIDKLRSAYPIRSLGARGRRRLDHLIPVLLRAVAQRRAPMPTLARTLSVIESIARRSVYLALLVERPLGLSQLVRLCEASPMIARQIARYPALLDELLDARTLYAPLPREPLERDADTQLAQVTTGDTEREMDCLRQFKASNVLRVAAADVSGAITVDAVSTHLTDIAEVTLSRALSLAWRDMRARHGDPVYERDAKMLPAPFAIVGYGKLGGLELGYGSDLDLVFVHGCPAGSHHTQGPRPINVAVFFVRLAQRIIHFLSTRTAAGVLYACDARLRPSGSKGLLVTSIASYRHYQLTQAWTWEHQAIVRARVVCGDEDLARSFAAIRLDVINAPRDPATLLSDVRAMRARMLARPSAGDTRRFDIKRDAGGIADIEFIVQYCALRWPLVLRDYLPHTDNERLLRGIAATGLMAQSDASLLADAYRQYRERVHALALEERDAVCPVDELQELREAVSDLWSRIMEGGC